jgi:polygalacturonase
MPTATRYKTLQTLVSGCLFVVAFCTGFGREGGVEARAEEVVCGHVGGIQSVIDSLAREGQHRVVIPMGVFRTGPLRLRSGIELHLMAGAVLAWDTMPGKDLAIEGDPSALITIADAENVRITGSGAIDGNGAAWWAVFLEAKAAGRDFRRPQLIKIDRCKNVEISGIKTLNPPNTHVSVRDSEDVVFRGLTMTAPDESPNTDAINLGRVKRVLIERCAISTGDDNVAIIASGKAGREAACEDITIRECAFGFGHGLSIGSYTQAGIRRLRVSNVTFDGTTSGIRLKSNASRGGTVEDLEYRDLTMKNVRYPIFIASHYPKLPPQPGDTTTEGPHPPRWSRILIENVTIRDCGNGPVVWGLPDATVESLTFRSLSADTEGGGVIVHARALFENTSLRAKSGPALRVFDADVTGIETAPLEGRFKPR